jgi:hypothetical protein
MMHHVESKETRVNIPLNEWNGSKAVTDALDRIQKENERSSRTMMRWTVVAAIAALVAAWPVVKEWGAALLALLK